jgi:hypothetical protein
MRDKEVQMKIRVLSRPFRLVVTVLLVAMLVPTSPPGSAAAPAAQQGEQSPAPDVSALAGGTRTLQFPAQSLNYNPASGIISQYGGGTTAGLQWTDSASSAAFLDIPRPSDWDGTSPVLMNLYFTPIAVGSGNISFFIRPRAYDAGDPYADAVSLTSPAVPYASGKVLKQSFTIPAERFGSKALWVIAIQRETSSDTYSGNVNLLSVGLTYTGVASSVGSRGLPANGLNYNASYGVITPYGGGTVAGLAWAFGGGSGSAALLYIPRPTDWDGSSSITLRLYMKPTTSNTGWVNLFIRPRSYNVGDLHGDAASVSASAVYASASTVVLGQSFTIPAGSMGSSLWVIAIQRGGSGETYTDDVALLAVGLTYTARSTDTGSLGFGANGVNYNTASGNLAQCGGGTQAGLLWQGTGTAAFVDIPRPNNWDGTTDVTMRLYFLPTTAASGLIDFFIRPRAYNPGDSYADANSLGAAGVAAGGTNRVGRQAFTIPASRFGAKELWVIAIQRGGSEETYGDGIVLLAAELNYHAVERIYLPVLMK